MKEYMKSVREIQKIQAKKTSLQLQLDKLNKAEKKETIWAGLKIAGLSLLAAGEIYCLIKGK